MTKDMNLRDTGIVLSWLSGLLAALMSSLAGIWGKTGLAALFGEFARVRHWSIFSSGDISRRRTAKSRQPVSVSGDRVNLQMETSGIAVLEVLTRSKSCCRRQVPAVCLCMCFNAVIVENTN